MPIVSIITTFFNSSDTLFESILSVIKQDFSDFEFILVDDGSNDNSAQIVDSIDDKRIVFLKPGRIGRAKALNLALNCARGQFIAVLDADDECLKDRLMIQSNVLINNSKIDLVCSNAHLSDNNSNDFNVTKFPVNHNDLVQCLEKLYPFPHSSVMYRREKALRIGGYSERCEKSIDYNFYLSLLSAGAKFKGIYEPLIKLKIYNTSWGKNDNSALQMRYAIFGLINYYQMKNGMDSFFETDNLEWLRIIKIFNQWFDQKKFQEQIQAKNLLLNLRQNASQGKFDEFFPQLIKIIKKDPLFWLYRGINFKFPYHNKSFLSFLEKNTDIFLNK